MTKPDETPAVAVTAAPAATFTRFERARIIGARALQIGLGAPILIKLDGPRAALDPVACAEAEFAEGVIPVTVLKPKGRA